MVFALTLFMTLCSVISFAQNDRRAVSAASSIYVISANAGGVNYVEGKVAVTRKAAKSGYLLKGDELEVGDRVATGADGKVEIHLNPGSLLRLAENSEFEFATTSLDDLQLKLNSGSAMLEVITDAEFTFSVKTPKTAFYIITSGVYRIDTSSDGTAKIEVWKGRALSNETEVKTGRQATVSGSETAVAKFDRGEKDALEVWSKTRAKELAKINSRLQNSATRASLLRSFNGSGWNMYGSYGLWVYDSMFGGYCFLPFGYGWNSPYGYQYRRDIWHYNLPPIVYNPQTTSVTPRPPEVGSGGVLSDKYRNPRSGRESDPIRVVPPYLRIQKDTGVFAVDNQTDVFSSPNSSTPIRMSPPPSVAAPPPPSLVSPSSIPSKVRVN